MEQDIVELYPNAGSRHRLQGLYMDQIAEPDGDLPFIYSNFISSLDGRIAVPGPDRNSHQVPPAIANHRDWRLFQELAAQADLLITSARYFRQSADQEAQAELPVGTSAEFDDLRAWRIQQGLRSNWRAGRQQKGGTHQQFVARAVDQLRPTRACRCIAAAQKAGGTGVSACLCHRRPVCAA
jgi:hypothetical protein